MLEFNYRAAKTFPTFNDWDVVGAAKIFFKYICLPANTEDPARRCQDCQEDALSAEKERKPDLRLVTQI